MPQPLDAVRFHQRLPGYRPTPLIDAPSMATELGLGRLWIKHEQDRFGLPAFKALGASWCAYRLLDRRAGGFREWSGLDELRVQTGALRPLTLVAATAGNHGRAVAWFARQVGLEARIYLPAAAQAATRAAIGSEGAEVVDVNGDYDDAVARAAADVGPSDLLVSDVALDVDDLGPRYVIEGYETLFAEIDDALASGDAPPDLVAVPVGVGSLAAAARAHYREAAVIGVESDGAACVAASRRAGRLVSVDVPTPSTLPGIDCGTPSLAAWPWLQRLDDVVAVTEPEARRASNALRTIGVAATPTGAAALAGLAKVNARPGTTAVVVVTEAASPASG